MKLAALALLAFVALVAIDVALGLPVIHQAPHAD